VVAGASAGAVADAAGADAEADASGAFLSQAAKATANKVISKRDFFMGFP
jgi:hypothetical protein